MNLSNSAVIPVNGNRTTNTISELQKRISDLKVQVTKERSLKHAVAQQLGTFRQESAKMLQQKQKIWESKFRELQKEKHGLSAQLQKLNMENPRHLLARGEEVSLTKEDLKRLRQEIEEQESLIKGYQMENEKALEKLREVQLSAKEKEKKMTEEIVAISDQLACLQASATSKPSKEDTYASLSESLTLRGEILDVQAREEALITELDTVKKEKKYLEKKILDLEETLKIQIKSGVENCVPMLDASCECVLITNYTNNDGSGMFGHSEDLETNVVPDDTWERKLENHENKNLLNYENILKASLGEGQKKIQNLQKRMEKMKRDYELRIRELKNQILKKSVKNVEHGNSRRVKDLEAQITQVRSFYMKKVKDLNDKLNAKQSLLEQIKTGRLKSDPTSKRIAGPSSQNLHEKIALLENIIAEKDAAIKNLEDKNLNTKRDDNVCQLEVEGKLTAKTKEEITENSCNGTVTENSKESKDLEDYLHAMYEKGEVQIPTKWDFHTWKSDLKQMGFSQEGGGQELISFNQALSRVCENCAKTFSFSGGKQEQHLKLTMSSAPCGSGVNIANRSKHTGHEKVFYPRQQGVTCNSKLDVEMQPMDPSQQLQILKRKVLEMEERQNQRECEWQRILIDTKRLLSLEHDMTERKWELAMEVKNSEIERFKLELEAILEAAIKLQKAQLKPSLPNISSYDLR